jgi:hypothetical protein
LLKMANLDTKKEKVEGVTGVLICKFVHPDGRACGSPVQKRGAKSNNALCFQHALQTRLHPKKDALRATNVLRSQLELDLTARRRAHRLINDRRARALRPLCELPILSTADAIARTHDLVLHAAAVGAVDARVTRIMLNCLRIARMNLKHTTGPMFADGYTPPLFRPPSSKAHAPRAFHAPSKKAL